MMSVQWPPTLLQLLRFHSQVVSRVGMAERLAFLLEEYDPFPFFVVKVTGTNGKGSVSAMLESMILANGKSVGCFTSPHLVHVSERFRANRHSPNVATLERLAQAVLRRIRLMTDLHGADFFPSFFEVLMLIAVDFFLEEGVDFAIFEAGVGGSNDAVSLLPGALGVITSIGLDHQAQLGHSLAAIASDKAGICKLGSRLVLAQGLPSKALRVFKEKERSKLLSLVMAPKAIKVALLGLAGSRVDFWLHNNRFSLTTPLAGRHQVGNLQTAVGVILELFRLGLLSNLDCLFGVELCRWPCRMQWLPGPPSWLLDVAHNPQAIRALRVALCELGSWPNRILVYGASAEKDYVACLVLLAGLADKVILVDGFYRAVPTQDLACHLPASIEVLACFHEPLAALNFLKLHELRQVRIVCGSVFLVGSFAELLGLGNSAG